MHGQRHAAALRIEGPRTVTDPEACRELWRRCMPDEVVFDLWEARECFHLAFRRPLRFLADEASGAVLPLSWIGEKGRYGFFPGETWMGKTWLEQNKLTGPSSALAGLTAAVGAPFHLRYLCSGGALPAEAPVDETGYLFRPPDFGYEVDRWWGEYSGKNAKRLRRDVEAAGAGASFHYDREGDFDDMVRLNLGRFGDQSYFHDPRFLEGFRRLVALLGERGWLRVTTVEVGGRKAAIDFGCLYRDRYTLLAGGTDPDFPGIAKVINLHHIERACRERMREVDFLCGDFKWKPLFHLAPRPLYLLADPVETTR